MFLLRYKLSTIAIAKAPDQSTKIESQFCLLWYRMHHNTRNISNDLCSKIAHITHNERNERNERNGNSTLELVLLCPLRARHCDLARRL